MLAQKIIANRFEIKDPRRDLLGRGGMGDVFRGLDQQTNKTVAIKVLKPDIVSENPEFVMRFEREGEALRQLAHPNIVNMIMAIAEEGRHYLIMEFIPGGSLRDLLNKQPKLPMHHVIHIGLGLADALARAHDLGIIHRDLKPANVLLANDGTPRLSDFGVAHIAANPRLTRTGMLIGTPHYLSPEACKQEKLDSRIDIWALGVMLFETLTGTVPFTGESIFDIVQAIIEQPTPDITHYRPDIDIDFSELIYRMLIKERNKRIKSARMIGAELESLLKRTSPEEKVLSIGSTLTQPTTSYATKTTSDLSSSTDSYQVFISYKRHAKRDNELANYLRHILEAKGHRVFVDKTMRTGTAWLEEIDHQIKHADFMIVLLSKESADSEMIQSEVQRAHDYRQRQGTPHILPVRLAYEDLLPYSVAAFLNPLQYVFWRDKSDNERIGDEVLLAIETGLPTQPPFAVAFGPRSLTVSEDGRRLTNEVEQSPPLPEFDPRLLQELVAPGGTVKLQDKFYIERDADAELKRQAVRPGSITTIRASRQTGKSSLLVRGVHHARQQGAKCVHLDFQLIDRNDLINPDSFLRFLANFIVRKLYLDPSQVERVWEGALGPQDKLTYLMEDYVLRQIEAPIILAMDEADRLLSTDLDSGYHTDFFGLIRAWHNNAAYEPIWEKLNIIMVISTEPYLLIADATQSPFNVGTKLYLKDFSEEQVQDLNRRHLSPIDSRRFSEFMHFFGGQPYLTRKALYTLVTAKPTWKQFIGAAVKDDGPFSDHLRRQLWLLRDEPKLRDALHQVVHKNRCDDENARFRLLRAGLIKGAGEEYVCRCDLYRRYFEDKLG